VERTYVVQTRAGWGNGPRIGSFSTPFARVVQAALAARKKGNFARLPDVTPDLTAPELHVIALAQTAAKISLEPPSKGRASLRCSR
jgi:hypothetical protein